MKLATVVEKTGIDSNWLSDSAEFIHAVRSGVPGAVLRDAISNYGINRSVFANVLHVQPGNISRLYRKKKLTAQETEKVLAVLRIFNDAEEVFGSPATAKEWLNTPLTVFNGEKPVDLLDTFEGCELVEAVIRKVRFGDFS